MNEEEPNWEMVVPFVLCTDNGGPYDSDAFTAGFTCGWIYETMASMGDSVHGFVLNGALSAELGHQVDLMAMHCGWTTEIVPCPHDPESIHVKFQRPRPEVEL